MRHVVLVLLLAVTAPVLSAQEGPGAFDSREWDFGAIREADGPVRHAFQLFNHSDRPFRVERAIPGCTCVSAALPKGEIGPGEGAMVEVVFTPAGAAGNVQRSVEIYASGNRSLGTLHIRADVLPADRSIQERYPVVLADGLYASRADLNFGYLERGRETGKAFFVANASPAPMQLKVSGVDGSRFRVVCPTTLQSGEEARVEVWCQTPSDPSLFATLRASLRIFPEGRKTLREIPLSGLCLTLAPESDQAPRLRTGSLKLSRSLLSPTPHGTLEISNDGPSALVLHALELPEGLRCSFRKGTRIGPGECLKLRISGTAPKGARITLFSNDPLRPAKEILIQTI